METDPSRFDYADGTAPLPDHREDFDYEHYEKVHSDRRRRASMRRTFALLFTLLFVWWFNNYTLKSTKVSVTSSKITAPVRLAVISDQHVTKHGISNRKIVGKIENSEPDIVIVLGDMYTRDSSWELMQKPINLMENIINLGYSVYFVNGEHDTDAEYLEQLSKVGVHVMNYEDEQLDVNGNKVRIVGIDNVHYTDTFDLSREFTLKDDCYNILMAHIPNYSAFSAFGADLTLCADTHGGMFQLPFGYGPVFDAETNQFFPKLRGETAVYDKGFFDYDGGTMFITSGIGASPLPVRFNNRPEVVIMDILPEK